MRGKCHLLGKNSSALAGLALKSRQRRIPINGSIEITRRCNFDCVHCYAGDKQAKAESVAYELDTERWKRIIDEIADAGCLFLVFTGGEPLLRDDFEELYRHACANGLLVTVFTNGYRIGEDVLNIFEKFPPNAVEISIYGASADTYGKITGKRDAFEKCVRNVEKLMEAGINARIKTVLLSHNYGEFEAIERIAEKRGLKFRFDAAVFPRLDGNKGPLKYRITPDQLAEKNLSTSTRRKEWLGLYERTGEGEFLGTTYACGAGTTSFHIDFSGVLKPCVMVEEIRYDLLEGTFMDGWTNKISKLRDKKPPLDFECGKCDKKCLCNYCPAFFRLENGSEYEKSEFLCEVGLEMAKRLGGIISQP